MYSLRSQYRAASGAWCVDYVEQEVADEKTPLSGISLHTNYLLWVIVGLAVTAIFILVLYLKEKKLQKKKNETS